VRGREGHLDRRHREGEVAALAVSDSLDQVGVREVTLGVKRLDIPQLQGERVERILDVTASLHMAPLLD